MQIMEYIILKLSRYFTNAFIISRDFLNMHIPLWKGDFDARFFESVIDCDGDFTFGLQVPFTSCFHCFPNSKRPPAVFLARAKALPNAAWH